MSAGIVLLIGIVLSPIVMFILAHNIEQGDTNAVMMYFVVFLFPALLLAIVNALYIKLITRLTKNTVKAILSFVPIILLILLALPGYLTIPGIDGNLTFVAVVEIIALGFTNLLWTLSIFKRKTI